MPGRLCPTTTPYDRRPHGRRLGRRLELYTSAADGLRARAQALTLRAVAGDRLRIPTMSSGRLFSCMYHVFI